MTKNKMPDAAWIENEIIDKCDPWVGPAWSAPSRKSELTTKYLRAEHVEALLKQIRGQIEFCKNHDHWPALDKTIASIDEFLGGAK